MLATKRSKIHKGIYSYCAPALELRHYLMLSETLSITRTKAKIILYSASAISFCVGHWKFVLQFFLGAIDTKSIFWKGINWHIEQIRLRRVSLDWGGSLFITLSFALTLFAKHPFAWIDTLY